MACPFAAGSLPPPSLNAPLPAEQPETLVSPGGTKVLSMTYYGMMRIDAGCTGGKDCTELGYWMSKILDRRTATRFVAQANGQVVLYGPREDHLPGGLERDQYPDECVVMYLKLGEFPKGVYARKVELQVWLV